MNDQSILAAVDLNKSFGSLPVIKGVNLNVGKGEFVAIVGNSGSGKTTLLSLLSGLERPSAGRVILDGNDITASSEERLTMVRRKMVGFVFQSFHLIPTLSAWENVALPLFPIKMSTKTRRESAAKLLVQMDMAHRLHHLPATLSGGEKQRVAIARALINSPKIVFADEPTGNLDTATGQAIMNILKRLNGENGMSVVMVTHDLELAGAADRIIHMRDGEIVS